MLHDLKTKSCDSLSISALAEPSKTQDDFAVPHSDRSAFAASSLISQRGQAPTNASGDQQPTSPIAVAGWLQRKSIAFDSSH